MDSVYYSTDYDIKWNRVWKLNQTEIDFHRLHWNDPDYVPIKNILEWPGNGDTTLGQAWELASYYDIDDDGKSVFNGAPVAYRGLFLIDKNGVVRHQLVNDLPLGRSVDEALRTLDALRHFEEYGEVCPANWQEGKEAMKASSEGVADYLSKH